MYNICLGLILPFRCSSAALCIFPLSLWSSCFSFFFLVVFFWVLLFLMPDWWNAHTAFSYYYLCSIEMLLVCCVPLFLIICFTLIVFTFLRDSLSNSTTSTLFYFIYATYCMYVYLFIFVTHSRLYDSNSFNKGFPQCTIENWNVLKTINFKCFIC